MFLIAAVDPAADNACSYWVLECIFDVFHDNFLVVIIDDDERCLTEILVPDGDFACHDVWQGVDKCRRAREEVVRVLYRCLIGSVGLQRSASVEQDDCTVLARLKTSVSFSI